MKKSMGLYGIIISMLFLPALAMQRSLEVAGRAPQVIYVCPDCSYCTDCRENFVAHSCEKVRQALVLAAKTYEASRFRRVPGEMCAGHFLRKRPDK